MARSLGYYVDVPGFSNGEWGDNDFTCVTRDGADIHLCPSPRLAREGLDSITS